MNLADWVSDDPLFVRVSLFLISMLILSVMAFLLYSANIESVSSNRSIGEYFCIIFLIIFFLLTSLYLIYKDFSPADEVNNTIGQVLGTGPNGLDELFLYIVFIISIGIIAFLIIRLYESLFLEEGIQNSKK